MDKGLQGSGAISQEQKSVGALVFVLVWVVCGLFFVDGGLRRAIASVRLVQDTRTASALVERVQVYGWDEGPFHDAWVRFTTETGEEIQTQVRQTTRGLLVTDPKEDGTVTVRYYPHDPQRCGSLPLAVSCGLAESSSSFLARVSSQKELKSA